MSGSGIRALRAALKVSAAFLAAALLAAPLRAEEHLEALRTEFHNQNDPVKRAKFFSKLGAGLIAEMRKLESAHQFDGVTPLFLEFHDSATQAYDGLAATGRDAEKHSGGYRELEMYLCQALHPLNDLIFELPLADREALRGPQKDIEDLDEKLVRALFPHEPGSHKTPPSAAQPHPVL